MSGQAFNVTKNTFLYNLVFIIVNTSLQITVSIFLSEMRNKYVKKTTQTLMLMPYFISWVVVGAFIYNIFNYEFGAFNTILKSFGFQSVDVMGIVGAWKYILVFFSAWNGVGYGSIVYMAAITGIDKELYEASELDGANIFQQIWRITIPSIKPTIIIMILLNVGSIFRGNFSMFYQIIGNNGLLFNSTDVIDTFVFRSLMKTQEVGMASAAGLYQSVLCFAIIMITNGIIKRVDSEYALF
ncbi:MAG: binding-protein-dependent transport system inner rane component [Eubacterium sp.]|nr:binding-protein-dependent transport system inner rane component [Eubacterium sp.]